jgi:hypothetical protein
MGFAHVIKLLLQLLKILDLLSMQMSLSLTSFELLIRNQKKLKADDADKHDLKGPLLIS